MVFSPTVRRFALLLETDPEFDLRFPSFYAPATRRRVSAGPPCLPHLFEGEAEGFIIRNSSSPASGRALEKIIEFVHQQVR